jgi:hypothetical protein
VLGLLERLGKSDFESHWAVGAQWGLDEAIREALSTEQRVTT